MNLHLGYFLAVWIVIAVGVLVLLAKRRMIASEEDDSLHVMEGASTVSHQAQVAQKLEQIDKWGKTVTVIAVVYGLLLTCAWIYQVWVQNARTGV
jgi:hypothetical protein